VICTSNRRFKHPINFKTNTIPTRCHYFISNRIYIRMPRIVSKSSVSGNTKVNSPITSFNTSNRDRICNQTIYIDISRTIIIGVTRQVFAANAGGGLNEFARLFGTEI